MSTLSSQSLQSLTVAVGPGTTKEIDTLLGTNSASITSLTTTVNTLDAFKTEITSGLVYTANLYANSFNGNVTLVDGNLTNLSDGTTATVSWEAANQILVTGIGATPTLTGAAGGSPGGLKIGASGRRLGFFGATPVIAQAITGAKAGNTAVAGIIAALVALGLCTDSTT